MKILNNRKSWAGSYNKIKVYVQWDDDHNEHLSYDEGIAWMRRFVEDINRLEGKRINKVSEVVLKIKGRELYLLTGYW